MSETERLLDEPLSAAMHRLASMARGLDRPDPKRGGERFAEDIRRISGDLERAVIKARDAADARTALQSSASLSARRATLLFMLSPTPCFVLDRTSVILEANPAAAKLVNTSLRHLPGRPFHMFVSADRQGFLLRLASLQQGDDLVRWPLEIRPRERCCTRATFAVVPETADRLLVLVLPPDGAAEQITNLTSQ